MIAAPEDWRRRLGRNWPVLVVLAAIMPELSLMIRPIWQIEWITDVTFRAVAGTLERAGYEVVADPVEKVIGTAAFSVEVSAACSGVEGFALITVFLLLYTALFRQK